MATCPQCERPGTWSGQSGTSNAAGSVLEDRYRDTAGHTWTEDAAR